MTAPRLAALAGLLADRTRATFCLALLDGRAWTAWTAGELARHAGVAPATATEHLHKLVGGGLLVEHRQGRHRYVRLAGPDVAHLLEGLTAQLTPEAARPRGLRAATTDQALARARTCYDHLAGGLGVALTDTLARDGLLELAAGFALTPSGVTWMTDKLGADLATGTSRPLARGCLDWTERRPHLAGVAGAAVCRTLLNREWITRIGSGRAVRVTPAGTRALTDLLGPAEAWPAGPAEA
jgi:DNA-binding transcriptional ArsR family regulator